MTKPAFTPESWKKLREACDIGAPVNTEFFVMMVCELNDRIEALESKGRKKSDGDATRALRELFHANWEARYSRKYPRWGAKENGILKRWLASVGAEEAPRLIEAFVRWNDPFVVKCGHALELLATKTVELSVWLTDPNQQARQIASAEAQARSRDETARTREEIAHHVRRYENRSNPGRHNSGGGEVPFAAKQQIPGPRGLALPRREVEGDGDPLSDGEADCDL